MISTLNKHTARIPKVNTAFLWNLRVLTLCCSHALFVSTEPEVPYTCFKDNAHKHLVELATESSYLSNDQQKGITLQQPKEH